MEHSLRVSGGTLVACLAFCEILFDHRYDPDQPAVEQSQRLSVRDGRVPAKHGRGIQVVPRALAIWFCSRRHRTIVIRRPAPIVNLD